MFSRANMEGYFEYIHETGILMKLDRFKSQLYQWLLALMTICDGFQEVWGVD